MAKSSMLILVRHAMPSHGPQIPAHEWELGADGHAAARFEAAVREHLASAQGNPLIIATHGMAMTVWLTSHRLLEDPAAFWSELRFPDAHIVGHDARPGTITRHPAATPDTAG
jgi:broad specificity phosphatase PhoE